MVAHKLIGLHNKLNQPALTTRERKDKTTWAALYRELLEESSTNLDGITNARLLATCVGDDAFLLEILPNVANAIKRTKEYGKSDEKTTPNSEQSNMEAYALARKQGNNAEAIQIGRNMLHDRWQNGGDWKQLLVAPKLLRQRAEKLEHEQDVVDRDALIRELHLWEKLADMHLLNDENGTLNAHGDILSLKGGLEKETTQEYVSLHDATYWLPATTRDTKAPDGTLLGDWLLENGRGKSALTTQTGRRSLEIAAQTWAETGAKTATLQQVSSAPSNKNLDEHTDQTTMFFKQNRISDRSAQATIDALHQSANTPTLLPLTDLYTDKESGMRGYFLPRNDPRGMQLGVITGCCQHPAGAGSTCAEAGQTHPASGFFVVEDRYGKIVAQSWMWAGTDDNDKAGIIFDNIETSLQFRDHADSTDNQNAKNVRSVYEQAACALATRFDRVLVGGNNDINMDDLQETVEPLQANSIGYKGYLDSQTQRDWHKRGKLTKDANKVTFYGLKDGFKIVSGNNTVHVNTEGDLILTGPKAKTLAQKELAKMTTRNYRITANNGKPSSETLDVLATDNHGWNIDPTTLPLIYGGMSPAANSALEDAGIPVEERERWLQIGGGGIVERAIRAYTSGWDMEMFENLKHTEIQTLPEVLKTKGAALTQKQYLAMFTNGAKNVADALLQDSEFHNTLRTVARERKASLVSVARSISTILPIIYQHPNQAAQMRLISNVVNGICNSKSNRSGGIGAATLHATKIIDELLAAGLTEQEIKTMAATKFCVGITGKGPWQRSRDESPIKRAETRKIWCEATAEERQQMAAIKNVMRKKLDGDITAETQVQEFAKRDIETEQTPAMTLDRNHPLRAMRTLDAAKMFRGEKKDYTKLAAKLMKPYTETIALLEKHEFPTGEQMATLLKRNMNTATQILTAANIALIGRDKNDDIDRDWYKVADRDQSLSMSTGLSTKTLLTLTGLSKKRHGEVITLLETLSKKPRFTESVALLAESGFLVDDLGKGKQPIHDWNTLQVAIRSGLKSKELREIMRAGIGWDAKMMLISNKDARAARAAGLSDNTLKLIATWAKTHILYYDQDVPAWLVQYAAGGKKAAKRVRNELAKEPRDGIDAIRAILHEKEIPEILGGIVSRYQYRHLY